MDDRSTVMFCVYEDLKRKWMCEVYRLSRRCRRKFSYSGVSYHVDWHQKGRYCAAPHHRWLFTMRHGITSQKTSFSLINFVRSSHLAVMITFKPHLRHSLFQRLLDTVNIAMLFILHFMHSWFNPHCRCPNRQHFSHCRVFQEASCPRQ